MVSLLKERAVCTVITQMRRVEFISYYYFDMLCSLIALCSLASCAFFWASRRALSDSATSAFRTTVDAYFFSSAAALASIYSNSSMWLMRGWLDAKNSSVLENDFRLNGF